MRILMAHNRYQQMGGEDVVFDSEAQALQAAGHTVERFVLDNSQIRSWRDKVQATINISHNGNSVGMLRNAIDGFQPDVLQVHNFFPLLTPGALAAAADAGVPIIQTLHNYRSLCANSMFFRNGQVCRDCTNGSFLPGVINRCYRGSAVGSLAIGHMGYRLRQIARSFPQLITFIALTNFSKRCYVEGGFNEDQIVVKGNALADPGMGQESRRRQILFVGRLSYEKGADFLCRVAEQIDAEFTIAGTGPDYEALSRSKPANVTLLGPQPRELIFQHMKKAAAVAVPSRWFEACPMTVLEAFATGTPVIASDLGSLAELVTNGKTGLLARADDELAWRQAIATILAAPEEARQMGRNARALYLERYTEEVNLHRLIEIYSSAVERSKSAIVSEPSGVEIPSIISRS